MENYEQKYKDALSWMKDLYPTFEGATKEDAEHYFPELCESEDEKIRNEIIQSIQDNMCVIHKDKCIAWLEKQAEQKPNFCHHEVDFSDCSEEYRKAYYDGWNNCNQQHSQCKSEGNDVVKCLINGMKFYYEDNEEATWGTEKFSMKVKDILSWLEKQGEQKPVDKVEPKSDLEKGKWYVCNTPRYRDFVVGKAYYCPKNGMLKPNENEMARYVARNCFHLWTIQDAKEGDVLAWDDSNCIAIFSKIENDESFMSHGFIGNITGVFEKGYNGHSITNHLHPATKEQCAFLFQKMKEAGYEWDAEKKELKKIEQKPAWSEEDEEMIECLNNCLDELEEMNGWRFTYVNNKDVEFCEVRNWLKSLKERMKGE